MFMNLPKLELLVHGNVSIKLVVDRGLLERVDTSAENEKDHAKSKHVGHCWLIRVALNDLRCHIADSANFFASGTSAIFIEAIE